MDNQFLSFKQNVTLLGGGKIEEDVLSACLSYAPALLAADGGADQAFEFGHQPSAVIGDMDSVSEATKGKLDAAQLIETPDQNRTDFDKAIELIDAPAILCVGFMGGRLDHELACYSALIKQPEKPAILVGQVDICFHLHESIVLNLPIGTRVSLFPMAPVVASARGLFWPVDSLRLSPTGRIGTSNQASEERVTITSDMPGLLVILPRAALPAVLRAISG